MSISLSKMKSLNLGSKLPDLGIFRLAFGKKIIVKFKLTWKIKFSCNIKNP